MLATRYNGRQTDALASVASIEALYRDGMAEAARVLRPGGQCWVKTKDTVATERQRWHHITVHGYALDLGWYPRDLFLLIPPSPANVSSGRWARQIHARKVHSYLWVLETGGYRRRG